MELIEYLLILKILALNKRAIFYSYVKVFFFCTETGKNSSKILYFLLHFTLKYSKLNCKGK